MMIDWERVSDLRAEIGEEDFDEVVDLFLDEAEDVIARLSALAYTGEASSDLHFLKGSALNLGFRDLANLCQEGERRANSGDAANIDLAAVVRAYFESKAAFQMGLAQSSAA